MNWLDKSKQYEEQFLKDLKGLISIHSIEKLEEAKENAPFGQDVRKALDYMLDLGKAAGFEVIDYDGYAGAIVYGTGSESVGVLGHLDIVPLGEGWTKDPLGCEIHDGYVFGRGVVDDKGPTMAAFYAMKMMKDNNIVPSKKIILIIGCNEETGMACMDYYEKHGEIPTCGFTPDADFPVIYGEKGIVGFDIYAKTPTVIKEMNAGERRNIVIGRASAKLPKLSDEQRNKFEYYLSLFQLNGAIQNVGEDDIIEIEGKYFHSAMCYKGVNAALHILNFVGNTLNDKVSKDLYELLFDWKGSAFGIDIEGGYMGFLTMNTGIVKIKENEINVTIDIRYPNETNKEELISKIKNACTAKNKEFEIRNMDDSEPLFVDPDSALIQTLLKSYRTYSKDETTPIKTIGGGTYARKFKNFVAFGAEFPKSKKPAFFIGGPHEKDEAVCVEELMMAMAIYTDALEMLSR